MKIIRIQYITLLFAILILSCKQNEQTKNGDYESTKIDSIYTPNIGGIKQAIKIKTDDSNKPVLLFLSGGPGASSMGISGSFTEILKSEFTIVEWDQRNVGRTLQLNKSPQKPNVEMMSLDTYEVIKFTTKELNKEKIHLLGSSWGNVLGFNVVKNHPELLHSYFAVNTVINQLESDKILLKLLKQHYRNDFIAIKELESITIPFEKDEDLFYLWKWLLFKEGNKHVLTENYKTGFLKWSKEWETVMKEVMNINLPTTLNQVDCPIYFFAGKNDYLTSTEITEKYFELLNAPKKKMIVFSNSSHGIHSSEPIKFQEEIIEIVKSNRHSE